MFTVPSITRKPLAVRRVITARSFFCRQYHAIVIRVGRPAKSGLAEHF
jgi:hypothetical protein